MRSFARRVSRSGSATPQQPVSGSTIGRFRLDDLIVGDATSGLWRAQDQRLARTVAVRLIPPADDRQDELRSVACAAARVVDRHVARVLDVLDHESTLVIVSEWIDGIPLEQALRTPMQTDQALNITRSVADAIGVLHAAGVTHGRISPASVMLTSDGEVRLRGHCVDARLWGIAPGHDPAAADVHAVGALLMACLTTRWPGTPETSLRPVPLVGGQTATLTQLTADLPTELSEFAVRSLAAVPSPHNVSTAQAFTTINPVRASLAAMAEPTSSADTGYEPVTAGDPDRRQRSVLRRTSGVLVGIAVIAAVTTAGAILLVPTDESTVRQATGDAKSAAPVLKPRLDPVEATTAPTAAAVSLAPAPVEKKLEISSIGVFNVQTNQLVPGRAANLAIDSDVSTAWLTDKYEAADLPAGESSSLVVDLGSERSLRAIDLGLIGSDSDIDVRTATVLPTKLSGFQQFAKLSGVPAQAIVRKPRPVLARYILVRFTAVPWASDGYQGGITNLEIRGEDPR